MIDEKRLKAFKAYSKDIYKILEADLTNDYYTIIKSDQEAEQHSYNKISEWMSYFAKTGQVHQDDIESYKYHTDLSYLREYFLDNQAKPWRFKYRRLVGSDYRWVLLDMIPTEEYSADSQIVYLFIHDVDEEMADPNADNIRLRKQLKEQMAVSKMIQRMMKLATFEAEYDERGEEKVVKFSEKFKLLLGFDEFDDFPDERSSWETRIHPDDAMAVAKAENVSRNDRTNHTKFDIEYRVMMKDGEYHWFRSVGEYERWIDGMPYRFVGIFVDVNEYHSTISIDQER